MNRIYWDRDKISILTDQIESIEHKHYAIQLFLSIDKPLNLYVSGKLIAGKCVIVNHNLNPTKLSAVRSFYRMLLNPRKRLKTLGFKQVNHSFPFIRPHPLLRASRELSREKSREDIGF